MEKQPGAAWRHPPLIPNLGRRYLQGCYVDKGWGWRVVLGCNQRGHEPPSGRRDRRSLRSARPRRSYGEAAPTTPMPAGRSRSLNSRGGNGPRGRCFRRGTYIRRSPASAARRDLLRPGPSTTQHGSNCLGLPVAALPARESSERRRRTSRSTPPPLGADRAGNHPGPAPARLALRASARGRAPLSPSKFAPSAANLLEARRAPVLLRPFLPSDWI